MFYVYVLKSDVDKKMYIGRTSNLKRRFLEHQNGKVTSTKHRRPFTLIFYEAFKEKGDSVRRERYLKTSKGKSSLALILRESVR